MFHWQRQARQREQQLAELEKEMVEKSSSLESLHRQLHGATQQLEETRKRQAEGELSRHVVTPPRAKVRRHSGGSLMQITARCSDGAVASCSV